MNKSIFIFLFTSIIVLNALNAQQPINVTMDYNARFDKIIKQDEEIKIISSDSVSGTKTLIPKSALEYNIKREYSSQFVLYDFCKRNYKEEDVLKFIEDVFADTTRKDFFAEDLHLLPCNSVKKYASVKNIFIDYYKRNIKLNPNDSKWEQKFFDFQVVNNFPNTLELINNYFENINSDKRKLRNGQNLIIRLIEIGEEEKALKLLNFYFQKLLVGEIEDNLNLDESISGKDGGLLLALSQNDEISKKATDLLFQYYKTAKYGIDFDLHQFLVYIDKNRLAQIEKDKFDKYRHSDLSDSYNLEMCKRSMSQILSLAGEEFGKEIFEYIKGNSEYSFTFSPDILKDKKLTDEEKKDFLTHYKNNSEALRKGSKYTSYDQLTQYLILVYNSFPSITNKEVISYIPNRYRKTSWQYNWRDAKNYDKLIRFDAPNLEAVIDCHKDLTEVSIFGDDFPKELNKFQTFRIHSQGGLNIPNYLMITFNHSEKVLEFETDDSYGPLDYETLFNQEFSPLLQDEGIYNIQVTKEVTGDNRDFNYKIQIITEKGIEEFQYSSGSNWYTPPAFAKALNLSLIKLNTPLRFFQIETGEQVASFGLFEPNKIVPFAKKYDMQIGVLRSQDIFNDL